MTLGAFGRYAGPATLILSSLAGGAKHGYALTKDIAAFAGVRLAPGTLYEALSRLEAKGLIEPLPSDGPAPPLPAHRDRRRRPAGTPAGPAPGSRRRPAPPGQRLGPDVTGHQRPGPARLRSRWYPASWRARYGAEFTELLVADLAERPRCWRRTADVAVSGTLARLSRAGLGGQRLAPAEQARASLAALGCALAVFLTAGTAMWSQLLIGWQWAPPSTRATAVATVVMTGALLFFLVLAVLAAVPIGWQLARRGLRSGVVPPGISLARRGAPEACSRRASDPGGLRGVVPPG